MKWIFTELDYDTNIENSTQASSLQKGNSSLEGVFKVDCQKRIDQYSNGEGKQDLLNGAEKDSW